MKITVKLGAPLSQVVGEPKVILVHVETEGQFREATDIRILRYSMHLGPKRNDYCRRAAPISCALDTCENTRNTNGMTALLASTRASRSWPISSGKIAQLRSDSSTTDP